jgi:biopolymer transport protein ExbB
MFRFGARLMSVAFAVVALGNSAQAFAWWNDDWAFRKELTLDLSPAGANIPASATDVPILVRLSIANFPYFADAKPDGGDLRLIAADDKTPLKFHVEKFDPQAQIALLWVKLPQISGGLNADKFFLYYGNKEATPGVDPAGTYDAGQALVYHFGAAAPAPQDATGYKNEPQGSMGAAEPGSLIGSGLRLDGATAFSVPAAAALQFAPDKGYTVSAWIKAEGSQQAVVAALQEAGRELVLGVNGERAYALWRGEGKDVTVAQPAGTITDGWHHVALRAAEGKIVLLVDGAVAAEAPAPLQAINSAVSVGGLAGAQFYRGGLDELQVSGTSRSDAWVRAAATSQGMVAPLLVYGGDAQKDSGESQSYFASTLRNVTVDGWVIIAILSVLFVISVLLMLTKSFLLGRVSKGNRLFLDAYHMLRDDPADLERQQSKSGEGAEFKGSTLWDLYHHGMLETLKRLEGKAAGADRAQNLSAQSIEAIRATMDGTLVRSTQKLQSQMVWLTISIAGGPFLGLLGTVVGVMITFAAIAASGEVNVNAIAPGTAAALVATVAGLGVAIPCLFGYNYLNSRIKNIVADMRVFVDEFVARIAETYS